jgi:hypothetical protein
MTSKAKAVVLRLALVSLIAGAACTASFAQVEAPVVGTAGAIIVKTITHHGPSKYVKFQGTVMTATIVAITVRSKANPLAIQTFSLSDKVSAKMQRIIDKGGYQYGDKVTIYYDPADHKAMKIKGKPSKPI